MHEVDVLEAAAAPRSVAAPGTAAPGQRGGVADVDLGPFDPRRVVRPGEHPRRDHRREQRLQARLAHLDERGGAAVAQREEVGAAVDLTPVEVAEDRLLGERDVDLLHRQPPVRVRAGVGGQRPVPHHRKSTATAPASRRPAGTKTGPHSVRPGRVRRHGLIRTFCRVSGLVVVGGGAAGMSAASAARRVDPALPIVVLEATGHAAYGLCGLPYHLSGVVEADGLFSYPPDYFREKRGIDLRFGAARDRDRPRRPRGHLHPRRAGRAPRLLRADRRGGWERRAAADRGAGRAPGVHRADDRGQQRAPGAARRGRGAHGGRRRRGLHRAGDRRGAARARGGDDRRRAAAAGAPHGRRADRRRWWRRTSAGTSTYASRPTPTRRSPRWTPTSWWCAPACGPRAGSPRRRAPRPGPAARCSSTSGCAPACPTSTPRATASRRTTACSAGPPTSRSARRPTRPDGWRARSRRAATRRSRASSARPW